MQFNASQHAERQNVPVPQGWYVVQIVNSEIKPTKTPGGARLNLQFKVLQGDYVNRVIFGGYNVQNANPVTVQIAMEELAELSRAVNVPVWSDTQELHGKPFNLKVKIRKQEGYDDINEPQTYKQLNDMEGVVYATKANAALSGPATFTGQPQQPPQPQGQGWGQPQPPAQQTQQQSAQPGWAAPQQQTMQQPQTVQQEPQQGNVNFNQAAQSQPWGNSQPQQTAQQPQQQEQPVQTQTQQQPQQPQQPLEGEHIPANAGGQPSWATQQVQPGTEHPVQQNNVQQPVEQPDDIQKAAQSQIPPWKQQAQ